MSDILKLVGALILGAVLGFFVARGLATRAPETVSESEAECQQHLAECYKDLDACKAGS